MDVTLLTLIGYALGAFGSVLLFLEFFQMPKYLSYAGDMGMYTITTTIDEPREHTWFGRVGALLLAVGHAILFFASFLA